MDAKSEVVLRQHEVLQGHVLLVNPPPDELFQQLMPTPSCCVWTWNAADAQYFRQLSANITFDIVPPQENFQQVIIFVPKAKNQLQYLLQQCAARLPKGGDIFLVGEKKAGIEGAAKLLQPYGKAIKLDSARHCQLWQVRLTQQYSAKAPETYLERYQIDLTEFYKSYQIEHLHASSNTILEIYALPGVFSQHALDRGSRVLLPYLAQVRGRKVLDFGCGAGVLGVILAALNPERTIFAADIDAFALHSTTLSFAANGLSQQLKVLAIGDIQDIATQEVGIKFSAIVTNPPFHQGINTDYQASENLCRYAKQFLKRHGELWLVANRFLSYGALLSQQFDDCQVLADQQEFKVFFAKA